MIIDVRWLTSSLAAYDRAVITEKKYQFSSPFLLLCCHDIGPPSSLAMVLCCSCERARVIPFNVFLYLAISTSPPPPLYPRLILIMIVVVVVVVDVIVPVLNYAFVVDTIFNNRMMEKDGLLPVPVFINGVEAHTVVRDLLTSSYEQRRRAQGIIDTDTLSPDCAEVNLLARVSVDTFDVEVQKERERARLVVKAVTSMFDFYA